MFCKITLGVMKFPFHAMLAIKWNAEGDRTYTASSGFLTAYLWMRLENIEWTTISHLVLSSSLEKLTNANHVNNFILTNFVILSANEPMGIQETSFR